MKTYNLGSFGISNPSPKITAGLSGVNAGPRRTGNVNTYGVSQNYVTPILAPASRDKGNAATYGINPDIIAGSEKSQWEMDDDTRDFLTDAFNTLNDPGYEEALGGGGSGGGGGGGGGPGFAGGPGSQHSTTWSFGNRPAFVPKGLL